MAKRKLKSKPVKKTKLEGFFHLTYRRFYILMGALVLLGLMHNLSYQFFGIEDPVLFLIAIILISAYLVKAGIYTLTHNRITRNNRI